MKTKRPANKFVGILSFIGLCLVLLIAVFFLQQQQNFWPQAGTNPAIIYSNGLNTYWSNNSYQSSINFTNTSPINTGSQSIAWNANQQWSTFYVVPEVAFNTTSYAFFHFAARASQQNQQYGIRLVDANHKAMKPFVPLANYDGGDPIPGKWITYDIPLSDLLGSSNPIIGGVILQNLSTGSQVLYLDDMRFTTQGAYIYNDLIYAPWQDESYHSRVNFSNGSPVYSGMKSIAWVANEQWSTLFF
jgi:hypothetical protein